MPTLQPTRFPDPVDQAIGVLDCCGDDYDQARSRAADNYVRAQNQKDADYWWEVLEVFDIEGKAQA